MKKTKQIGTLIALTFLAFNQSHAQWDPSCASSGTVPLYNRGTAGIGTCTISSGASLELAQNLSLGGNHVVFNSTNGVLDWGGGGSGSLFFRRLNTQGVFSSGYNTLMMITAGGNVAIGSNVTSPVSLLHVGGDITFGSAANKRKWRFVTQNWLDGGKMYLLPDKQDASGNPDYSHAIMIDPVNHNFNFGMEAGMVNVGIGRATGIGWDNVYETGLAGTHHYDANMCIGFNVQNYNTVGWQTYGDGTNNGSSLIWNNTSGELAFSVMPSTGSSNAVINSNYIQSHAGMRVRWNSASSVDHAQVIIGAKTITSGSHLDFHLSVDGKILAKEIYVTQTGWADYVFSDSYKRRSLDELESYIKENKHLPNVPTTAEMAENGNNTADTDRILLEKIEELTLYIIEQNKKIEELEKKVEKK